ncbi:MAG: cytochrome c maturation protein CcmE [Alphaproteobacteria bacterium]
MTRPPNRQRQRLLFISSGLTVLIAASLLVLNALQDSIVFFHAPSDIVQTAQVGQQARMGGLVVEGSITEAEDGTHLFDVTDGVGTIAVTYQGLLPDLFREGQGVVVEGALQANGTFKAARVLAKHDENYMPKEVADTLKEKGVWQGNEKEAE